MKFSQYIENLISTSGMTRKQVLEACHKSNDSELHSTDAITLSRWINGKTVPSLYKQILLVNLVEGSLLDFLKNIQLSDIKKNAKEEAFLDDYYRMVDNNHNSINYLLRSSERHVEIESLPINKLLNRLDVFHNNFSSFDSFFENTELTYKNNATLIACYEAGEIVGHIAFVECSTVKINGNEFRDVIFFLPVYYCDSSVLQEIMCNFFMTLLEAPWSNYKHALGLSIPGARLDFHKLYGEAETLAFFPPIEKFKVGPSDKGLFLIKIKLLKYFSKHAIVKDIVQRL